MAGHVRLGAVGALRDYYIKSQGSDGIAWSRGAANPFAGNVNTSGPYDRVDEWNELVLSDYQTGVGRVDPEAGGYLYGETDTRVPEQVILSQAINAITPIPAVASYKFWSLAPGQLTNSITRATYTLANNNYLAWQVIGEGFDTEVVVLDINAIWVYGECADGTVLRADIYSNDSNDPDTSLGNGSSTITNDFPGPSWHKIALTVNNLEIADTTVSATHFVVVRPTTGSITLHGAGNHPNMVIRSSSDGSSWSSVTTFQPFFIVGASVESDNAEIPAANIVKIVHTTWSFGNSDGPAFIGQGGGSFSDYAVIYNLDVNNAIHFNSNLDISGAPPTDAAVFLNRIYVARGASDNIAYVPVDLGVDFADGGVVADHLLSFGGYLWRSVGNDLYYSADVSTWTTVGQVCGDPWEIRSMAGLNGDVYCACDDGLYRIAPGDFVEGVVPWQPDENNGRSMVSHAGALYIIVNGRVWRFGQEGSMRDIWVARDDDLPANRLGEVVEVAATDLWVVALVKSTTGRSSIWAYQDEGWHHLTTLPTTAAQTMYYERSTFKLWIATSDGYGFSVYMPANALNPYNDPDSIYMPAGWIQQDRYKGGQHLLDKAFYSVTVVGDNLSTNVNCKIYWQDEDSTGWELLGTADSDNEELVWPASTRPTGKWIKLGALLQTNDADETPRIRAIVLKFLPIVNDRRQDQMTFTFKSYQQGIDGTLDTYTLEEQRTHFESLIGFDGAHDNFVFLYEDPFGDQMEVTIASHQWSIPIIAYEGGAKVVKEAEVTVVLKQLPDNLYSG